MKIVPLLAELVGWKTSRFASGWQTACRLANSLPATLPARQAASQSPNQQALTNSGQRIHGEGGLCSRSGSTLPSLGLHQYHTVT